MDRLSRQLCDAVRDRTKPPEAGRDLWNAFQRLSATRTYNPAGPNPIQPSEIVAWCQLMRTPLATRHIDILLAMDRAWIEGAYVKDKAPEGVKTLPPVSKHALSAGLLDAIMG